MEDAGRGAGPRRAEERRLASSGIIASVFSSLYFADCCLSYYILLRDSSNILYRLDGLPRSYKAWGRRSANVWTGHFILQQYFVHSDETGRSQVITQVVLGK